MIKKIAISSIFVCAFGVIAFAQDRTVTLKFKEGDVQNLLDYFKQTSAIIDRSNIGLQDARFIVKGADLVSQEIANQVKPQLDSNYKPPTDTIKAIKPQQPKKKPK